MSERNIEILELRHRKKWDTLLLSQKFPSYFVSKIKLQTFHKNSSSEKNE